MILHVHQASSQLNLNYAAIVKHDIDKLFIASFIKHVEETTWLSPIVVMPNKYGKPKICVDFRKLNSITKKNPYPLPFTNEVISIVVGHEVYTFLGGFLDTIKLP